MTCRCGKRLIGYRGADVGGSFVAVAVCEVCDAGLADSLSIRRAETRVLRALNAEADET